LICALCIVIIFWRKDKSFLILFYNIHNYQEVFIYTKAQNNIKKWCFKERGFYIVYIITTSLNAKLLFFADDYFKEAKVNQLKIDLMKQQSF